MGIKTKHIEYFLGPSLSAVRVGGIDQHDKNARSALFTLRLTPGMCANTTEQYKEATSRPANLGRQVVPPLVESCLM